MTADQVIQHNLRVAGKMKDRGFAQPVVEQSESALHRKIMDYCDKQWPRWKYIRARMDKRSTIEVGCQDVTIFMPQGRVLCIECKIANAKLSPEQLAWAHEMRLLGHAVHVVRTFEQFLQIIQ